MNMTFGQMSLRLPRLDNQHMMLMALRFCKALNSTVL